MEPVASNSLQKKSAVSITEPTLHANGRSSGWGDYTTAP